MEFGPWWTWAAIVVPWCLLVAWDLRRDPGNLRWLFSLLGLLILMAVARNAPKFDARLAVIAVTPLILVGAGLLGEGRDRRRWRGLAEWGPDHGFEAVETGPRPASETLPPGLLRLPLFSRTAWPKTASLMSRRDEGGGECLLFELRAAPSRPWAARNGFAAGGTVVAIHRPGLRLPLVQVRPRSLPGSPFGRMVGEPIDLMDRSAFPSHYRIGGHEPTRLGRLFEPGLTASLADRPGWVLDGEGDWLAALYYDVPKGLSLRLPGFRRPGPEAIEGHLAEALEILENLASRAERAVGRDPAPR